MGKLININLSGEWIMAWWWCSHHTYIYNYHTGLALGMKVKLKKTCSASNEYKNVHTIEWNIKIVCVGPK